MSWDAIGDELRRWQAHSVHSVSNLALLASGHHSALNNAVFEVKRRRILELDRRGVYLQGRLEVVVSRQGRGQVGLHRNAFGHC